MLGEGDGCWECCISIKLYDQPSPDFDSILFMLRYIHVVCYFVMLQCVLQRRWQSSNVLCVFGQSTSILLSVLCRDELYSYTPELGRRKKRRLVGRYVILTGSRCHSCWERITWHIFIWHSLWIKNIMWFLCFFFFFHGTFVLLV